MQLLSTEMLQQYLSEICSCHALEVYADGDKVYIPYMMNDALECYMCFSDAQLIGQPQPSYDGESSFELIQDSKSGIIFRQGTQNVFTLWYNSAHQHLQCYRYDQIGHFWVSGQEHWRRLVYILGTIYDKYCYMGDEVCNPEELELLKLMEFAPLYHYSPIHEPLDDIYPNTLEGIHAMRSLAREVNDRNFLLLLDIYHRFPISIIKNLLQRVLNRPARIPLYERLFHKIETASRRYPERDYGEERNRHIVDARNTLSQNLLSQGYVGEYPVFQKDALQIVAMEEHPFTILESSNFPFRIQLMESETRNGDQRINAGFFRKRGNRRRIVKMEDITKRTMTEKS